jgi:thiol:disulfide interchange protein
MKTTPLQNLPIAILILFLSAMLPAALTAAEAPKGGRSEIYDESLSGSKQIADALVLAKKGNKRILLQFGANWCGWCHKLHKLLASDKDIAEKLKADYVVLLIDVNKGHNADLVTKYQVEKLGLPCIVILDSEGKHLTTKNTAELEEGDHHSPAKVIAFLKAWSPGK